MVFENRTRKTFYWILSFLLLGMFTARFLHSSFQTVRDFSAFWSAGRALDFGIDPYRAYFALNVPKNVGPPFHFLSPIFLAELMMPFGSMPFHVAKLFWLLLCSALAVFTLLLVCRLSRIETSLPVFVLGCVGLIAFNPFMFTIDDGQTDLLVLFAVTASWYLLRKRKEFWSGVLLCVGFVNPHLVLGVGAYYLFRTIRQRNFKLLMGMLVGSAILLAVSLPYAPYVLEWVAKILPEAQQAGITEPGQITWIHLFYSLFGAPYDTPATIFVDFIAFSLAFCMWTLSSGELEVDFAVAAVLSMMTTTFAFNQDYLVLVLVFPMLYRLYMHKIPKNHLLALTVCVTTLFSGMCGAILTPKNLAVEILAPLVVLVLLWACGLTSKLMGRVTILWMVVWVTLTVGGYALSVVLDVADVQSLIILGGMLAFLVGTLLWHPNLNWRYKSGNPGRVTY